jgi:hypothetical protein
MSIISETIDMIVRFQARHAQALGRDMAQLRHAVGDETMDEALRLLQERQLRAAMCHSGDIAKRHADHVSEM